MFRFSPTTSSQLKLTTLPPRQFRRSFPTSSQGPLRIIHDHPTVLEKMVSFCLEKVIDKTSPYYGGLHVMLANIYPLVNVYITMENHHFVAG